MIRSNDRLPRNVSPALRPQRGGLPGRLLVGASLLLLGVACQSEAPKLEEEPRAERAPATLDVASPAPGSAEGAGREAPAGQVGLARYEAPSAAPAVGGAAAAGAGASTGVTEKPRATAASSAPLPLGEGAAKPAAGELVQGTVVTEEPFSVWLQAVSPLSAGAPAKIEAVLVAKAPYHCNAEYPHKFKLGAAPAGLSFPEATVKGMQVTPERGVLAIPVEAKGPGKATVSGTLSFSVCTEERCLVEKRDLALNLDVE